MVDRWINSTVMLVLGLVWVRLGRRLGLFRAESRVWQVCLYCAVCGAVVYVSAELMVSGFADFLSVASLEMAATGSLLGVLIGLLISYTERRRSR